MEKSAFEFSFPDWKQGHKTLALLYDDIAAHRNSKVDIINSPTFANNVKQLVGRCIISSGGGMVICKEKYIFTISFNKNYNKCKNHLCRNCSNWSTMLISCEMNVFKNLILFISVAYNSRNLGRLSFYLISAMRTLRSVNKLNYFTHFFTIKL